MNTSTMLGSAEGTGPALCLDALDYARRVFGTNDAHWFETQALLATYRPMMQSLRPKWLLFPLREWAEAWWGAKGPDAAGNAKPLRTLKDRLAHEGLRVALLDALCAVQTITGSAAGLALQVDGPEQWLASVGEQGEIDEGDAEDVVVYLAALSHTLSCSGLRAVVVCQWTPTQAAPDERYAALTNAAAHHEWASVLCCDEAAVGTKSFDLLAARQPLKGFGAWMDDAGWTDATSPQAPFIVARVPAQARPDQVLAQLACWRGNL